MVRGRWLCQVAAEFGFGCEGIDRCDARSSCGNSFGKSVYIEGASTAGLVERERGLKSASYTIPARTRTMLRRHIQGRALLAAFAITFSLAAVDANAIDCGKARSSTEAAICRDPTLNALDDELNRIYRVALSNADDPDRLIDQQRRWLDTVRDRCQDNGCLTSAYVNRLRELVGFGTSLEQESLAAAGRVQKRQRGTRSSLGASSDGAASASAQTGNELREPVSEAPGAVREEAPAQQEGSPSKPEAVQHTGTVVVKGRDHASPPNGVVTTATLGGDHRVVRSDSTPVTAASRALDTASHGREDSAPQESTPSESEADPRREIDVQSRGNTSLTRGVTTMRASDASRAARPSGAPEVVASVATDTANHDLKSSEMRRAGGDDDGTFPKLALMGMLLGYVALFIGGVRNKFVVYYDKTDFLVSAMVFISPIIGALLSWFLAPHGYTEGDPESIPMQVSMYAGLIGAIFFAVLTMKSSVQHNQNLFFGILVGVFKIATALLAFAVLIAYQPTSRTDTLAGAMKRSHERGIFLLVVAILGLVASRLINGERVYLARGLHAAV